MPGKSIDDKTIWNVPTPNGLPNYDPITGEKNPYLTQSDPFGNRWETHPSSADSVVKDEDPVKYGRTATEILKEEYPTIYNGYMDIVEEQLELFAKKHIDYGMSNISAGTSLSNEEERSFALTGLWYRINDKVNRWKNLLINNRGNFNESLTDTYQDIVNYGIISQLVEKGQWKK